MKSKTKKNQFRWTSRGNWGKRWPSLRGKKGDDGEEIEKEKKKKKGKRRREIFCQQGSGSYYGHQKIGKKKKGGCDAGYQVR